MAGLGPGGPFRAAHPPARAALGGVLAALLCAGGAFPAWAGAPPAYSLVVLGEPKAPPTVPSQGDTTLSYHVLEIFAGDPGAISIVVRHQSLTGEQRSQLTSGGRVILLANPDPEADGRWLAPPPLRATPSAIDSFRHWSAPADVRPPRDVEDVIAEARAPGAGVPVPEATIASLEDPPVVEVVVAEPEIVEVREIVVAPPVEDATPVASAPPEAVSTRERPVPAASPPEDHETWPEAEAGSGGPPLTHPPVLLPPHGPGLPPSPPPARPLGPALSARSDLKIAQAR